VKIAVTGGSGFIGSATIEAAVARGHEAWPVDRVDGYDVQLKGSLGLGLRDADAVIHLAGLLGTSELFDTPHEAVDINIHGTLNVLQWCRENSAAYVGITMPPVFPSVYTATKVCAQRLATAWHRAYGVPVSHVRAFNAHGAGQAHGPGHPQKILPTFASAAWANEPIPVWGDGSQTVDLIHSSDVGLMLVDAITSGGSDDVFDAGTGVPLTVRKVAEFILGETGSTAGIEFLPMRNGETPTHIVAQGDGWDLLDWRPILDWSQVVDTIYAYKP